jgi:hypothetical protein
MTTRARAVLRAQAAAECIEDALREAVLESIADVHDASHEDAGECYCGESGSCAACAYLTVLYTLLEWGNEVVTIRDSATFNREAIAYLDLIVNQFPWCP